ncbi:hypothetical protein Vadar_011984 [Vaccinium darrowii]|uniref:Uncharacterized protein n=1 Tax=Vaccinium darrowii TaxID=229202 RepID=A0ACB7Z4V3_9ERIC|nr:hypothetical protein Vadar_011984 [Vaccinium darrowii]
MFSLRPVLKTSTRVKDLCLLLASLLIFYLLLQPQNPALTPTSFPLPTSLPTTPTTLHHLLFSIASSSLSLPTRSPFLRLWYSPNTTRAYLFLDRPTPSPDPSLPPTLISLPTSQFPYSFPHGSRSAIRSARIVKESLTRLNHTSHIRWFVYGDDDTLFVPANLVRTLAKYDHEKWWYVGSGSEGYGENYRNSFGMGFGGGGFAISASLARVLAGVLDSCLLRYPHLYGSDARVFSCLAELGVELTPEPGFHQIDTRGDIFGMLSAHPLSPLLSLHHVDRVDPIFPNMTRDNALRHLFEAVNVDPGRVLQQTVCYERSRSFTVSVAWGYAIQVFEGNYYLPDLLRKERTFKPWRRNKEIISSLYMFDTREYISDPCKRPVVFFLKSAVSGSKRVYTDYTRHVVGNCSRTGAVNDLEQIRVFSQKPDWYLGEVKALRRTLLEVLLTRLKLGAVTFASWQILLNMHTKVAFSSLKMKMDYWDEA